MTATQTAVRPPRAGRPAPRANARGRRDGGTLLLLLPALVPVLVLSVGPLLYGIYLSFTDAQGGRNAVISFIGLKNFGDALTDTDFWSSFKIGLTWAVGVTVLQFLAALGLALLLNQNLRLRGLARVLAMAPWAMPPIVIGLMWRLVYHPNAGILNATLQDLHLLDHNVDWLNEFGTALPAIIVVGVWTGMPQTTVVLLAGLQGVPKELTEAAAVDGASVWRRFRSVTLPQLRPVIVAITSLDFVWNINQFAMVYALTQGGPGGRTRLPMLFAYEEAFRYGFFGYAAALGVAITLVVLVVLGFYLWRQMRESAR
ncbi:carbohydrate ABC transporter permease [Actinoallomurus sp. CA-150999]|uniref:carbohydrate ABC transporter permease n=1 Tax=Actinoallomurus sp. CA-150999 TaxID=3239887 RepID=UPI003D92811D